MSKDYTITKDAKPDISLKTLAVEFIRSRIMDGQYALGQRLSQNQLAKEMNTSRAPVQDAFVTLCHEGIVQVIPQKGTFVFNPNQEEINDLYEVNTIYEAGAMRLAMEKDEKELILRLEKTLELLMSAAHNPQEWVRGDRLFHATFIHFAGNPHLLQNYRKAIIRTTPLVFKHTLSPERMLKSYDEHSEIIENLKKRNIEKAASILRSNNVIAKA